MEIKKYFEFFGFNHEEGDEDKLTEQSELAKEMLVTLEMFIDMIDNQEDIKKLHEIEQLLKKYK